MATTTKSQQLLETAMSMGDDVAPIELTTLLSDKGPSDRQLQAIERRLGRNLVTAVRAFDKVDHDPRAVAAFAKHFAAVLATRDMADVLIEAVEAAQKETETERKRANHLQGELGNALPFKSRATKSETEARLLRADLAIVKRYIENEYGEDYDTLMLEAYEAAKAEEIIATADAGRATDEVNRISRMIAAGERGKSTKESK